ncbi:MAG TPA: hypothetical protein VJB96_02760 [Patescibacteria group bacterium]|nr:hypothetical protein [Patescibacteria group bacterium]
MKDATYEKFVKRWEEVTELPPQTLGPFTGFYKFLTKRFKVMPWPWFVGMSVLFAAALYLLLGSTITLLTSILQKGF